MGTQKEHEARKAWRDAGQLSAELVEAKAKLAKLESHLAANVLDQGKAAEQRARVAELQERVAEARSRLRKHGA